MSITNPDKVVTKQDLANFYAGIYPYLGGMPEMLANKFSKGDLYSTSEKMIGQSINGKPLYQKTVSIGAMPNATTKNVAHSISNLETVIAIGGYCKNVSSGSCAPLPYVDASSASKNINVYVTTSNIVVVTGNNYSAFTESYITIQYTKTTDSATSIGNDTDYSTTEKIIGTWIDGKPLYQKTFSGTFPSATEGTVATSSIGTISNLSNAISAEGYYVTSNNNYAILPWIMGTGSNSRVSRCYVTKSSSTGTVMLSTDTSGLSSVTAYVTVKYTKTT